MDTRSQTGRPRQVNHRLDTYNIYYARRLGDIQVAEHQVTCPDGHLVRCCWVFDPTSTSKSALLHYHGGGMIYGTVDDSIHDLKRTVAKTGVPIFSVDYTLAPTGLAPTQVIEGYAALNYVIETKELGVDPSRIGIMGESAGGGLAACLVHWTMVRPFNYLIGFILQIRHRSRSD
jgi:acetyl esterase/lipase